ncbi:MAG: 1,5-anhydro-D-fructose reductase [Lentisphaerae bacterium ADurb.BinA184]|nr:MAG: 1,5-anhydro-D-fructose reductase [Lentisphaerae bacterium ADurb.BinA184]
MKLVAGVIGCGGISRFHFAGFEKAGVRVKWVCDLDEARARPWAERCGARYSADWEPVVADPEVRIVDVLTPSRLHKPVCLAAIAAGKAVICEKTLAENADDALAIVRAAEKAGTVFYTSYMKRFIPAVEQAKALLPRLGRIISTHIRIYQNWGEVWDGNPASGFCHTPPGGVSPVVSNYGGGILVCGGSHMLDLLNFFLGRPTRLSASMVRPADRDYDLQATALMETAHGPVLYEAVMHTLERIGFLRDGWQEELEFTGTQGRLNLYSAQWDQNDRKASLLVHYDRASQQAAEYRYGLEPAFERALAFFCANIAKGVQGAQSRLTGYEVDELIQAIKDSATRRQAIDVNWRI